VWSAQQPLTAAGQGQMARRAAAQRVMPGSSAAGQLGTLRQAAGHRGAGNRHIPHRATPTAGRRHLRRQPNRPPLARPDDRASAPTIGTATATGPACGLSQGPHSRAFVARPSPHPDKRPPPQPGCRTAARDRSDRRPTPTSTRPGCGSIADPATRIHGDSGANPLARRLRSNALFLRFLNLLISANRVPHPADP